MESTTGASTGSDQPEKATGELKAPTGPLTGQSSVSQSLGPESRFRTQAAELLVFLAAILGAIALGLGISDYFSDHRYVSAYLIAYAGFLVADLLVRDDGHKGSVQSDSRLNRQRSRLPILLLFAAAPFERTYLYGGEPVEWLGALGLLLELLGLWLALGARIQWSYFTSASATGERTTVVKSGFYRYIRHPIYAGSFLVLLAWPLEYSAPITFVIALATGVVILRRLIAAEEAVMLARFGGEYVSYQRETDSIIPGVW